MPKPFEFDSAGVARLDQGWRSEGSNAQVDEVQVEGKLCLHIRAAGETTASWRRAVTLQPGKYRFEAKMRTAGVVATASGSGEGAGLRISGGSRQGQNGLAGDQPWQTLSFVFDAGAGNVVLVAELRASKGEVWFERDSLRLVAQASTHSRPAQQNPAEH